MGDPRNVAHAKKVSQEKHHKGKTQPAKKSQPVAAESAPAQAAEVAKAPQKPDAAKLEKSLAVLAKLKELEFHSRGNIEKVAELSLTIEDELKQKAFVEGIGNVYSAQEAFHSKISELIEVYQTECDRLKPAG
jgi:formamidopyrimidine-DNA glycosylase